MPRQVDMALPDGRLPQDVLQRRADAALTVRRHADGGGDPVCGEEAHPVDIVAQPVGILIDDGAGTLAIQLGYFQRQRRGDAVGLQVDHRIAGALLLPVGLGDLLPALLAHLGHLLEHLRVLGQHAQGILAEMGDDGLRGGRPHTVDNPRPQVALDAQQGRGLLQRHGGALQLPPVGGMGDPLPREHGLLTRVELGQRAHDGDLPAALAGCEDGVAVVVIAVDGAKDAGFDLFHERASFRDGSLQS